MTDLAAAIRAGIRLRRQNVRLLAALAYVLDAGCPRHREDCACVDLARRIGLDSFDARDQYDDALMRACDCGFNAVANVRSEVRDD